MYFVSSEDLENGKEDYDDDGMDDTKSIGSLPTWRALRETPMEVPGAATLGGNLLTVGGRIDGVYTCKQIFRYDPRWRKWKHADGLDLPHPLLGCGICSVSRDEFYVIGGCRDDKADGTSYPKVDTMYKINLDLVTE